MCSCTGRRARGRWGFVRFSMRRGAGARSAQASASGHASSRPHSPAREHVSVEDDIPEDDDPDLNESALSGRELIVRELGATVMEEFTNE